MTSKEKEETNPEFKRVLAERAKRLERVKKNAYNFLLETFLNIGSKSSLTMLKNFLKSDLQSFELIWLQLEAK